MALLNNSITIGLDIGESSTKLVVLKSTGSRTQVVKSALLSNREEGIVSEEELGQHLGPWLRERGIRHQEITLGVPQYLTIAQLSDFPPAKAQQLEEMVRLETQQVAGLSDEAFLHDYHRLQPTGTYKNPVLIGVCRESAIQARLAPLLNSNVRVVETTMDGYALALAYRDLVPEGERGGIHLLLDVGEENTTLAIMQDSQPVYVGSFTAGGHTFTAAMMRHLGINENEAERMKLSSRINTSHLDSPLTIAARAYVGELHTALESWQYQGSDDADEAAEAPRIERIYLSGGGARLQGFHEYLASLFDCKAVPLEPASISENADRMAIAYGLALHAALPAEERISLTPMEVTWDAQRRRRVPNLVVALILFACILAGWMTTSFLTMQRHAGVLEQESRELDRSTRLIDELIVLEKSIDQTQRLLIPFAARGNRNTTLIQAVELLGRYQQRDDWFFLLADGESYQQREEATARRQPTRPDTSAFAFGNGGASHQQELSKLTTQIQPWQRLIAAGFTPSRADSQWSSVRTTVDALNNEPDTIFAGVDILTQQYRSTRDIRLMAAWRDLVDMRGYALTLPLRQVEFESQNQEPQP